MTVNVTQGHRNWLCLISHHFFLHFAWVVNNAKCIFVTRVCPCVCLSTAAFPHYCMDPDVTWAMAGSVP